MFYSKGLFILPLDPKRFWRWLYAFATTFNIHAVQCWGHNYYIRTGFKAAFTAVTTQKNTSENQICPFETLIFN